MLVLHNNVMYLLPILALLSLLLCPSVHQLPKQLENHPLFVNVHIVNVPIKHIDHMTFNAILKKNMHLGLTKSLLVKLSWYYCHQNIRPGDLWHLKIKLKKVHGFHDPGVFNYEKYLVEQGIGASGYVVNSFYNRRVKSKPSILDEVNLLRLKLAKEILGHSAKPESRAVLVALALGLRQYLNQQSWNVFRNSGTAHLIAISGLHVGLVFAFMLFLMRFIVGYYWAMILSWLFVIAYAFLAGFSLPSQRAILMLSITIFLILNKRSISIWQVLLMTFSVVATLHAITIFAASSVLSFSAVTLLIYGFSNRVGKSNKIWQYLKAQILIFIGMTPVFLYYFKQISLLSPLANIVAIPLTSLIIMPILLLSLFLLFFYKPIALYLININTHVLNYLTLFLTKLNSPKWALYHHTPANIYLVFLAIIAVLILFAPRGWPGRGIAIFCFMPIFFYHRPFLKNGVIRLTMLDVGQGLAFVIKTRNHTLIYDTGPKFSANFDAGEAVLVPYLRFRNIKKIDKLIISHGDNDHIGGANSLLAKLPVKNILTSVPNRFHKQQAQFCHAGEDWSWDGVEFKILSPIFGLGLTHNNASCVLQITSHNKKILLTGDIEAKTEKILLNHYGKKLKSFILQVPHHGSATSSSWHFVKTVSPNVALFSTGYLNRFHFPNKKVLKRYARIHSKIYNTAQTGAVTLLVN
ncbi:MAG: DNA internalization-related competence protein ComEC/Rec2 [Gammaproteobacteria bacterium]|nr:DNA internalization-related competence protein ComEC/Rec2 [Gammaproteobacteria bacterium]